MERQRFGRFANESEDELEIMLSNPRQDSEDEPDKPSVTVIQRWVESILNDVAPAKRTLVYAKIYDLEPTTKEDLVNVSSEDVKDILGDLRSRRFVSDVKRLCSSGTDTQQQHHQQQLPQKRQQNNQDSFEFDFSIVTGDLLKACEGTEKLNYGHMKRLVNIVGDYCKAKKPASVFMTMYVNCITQKICNKFKHSLLDMFDGKVLGNGNQTLNSKVYTYIENTSRHARDVSDDGQPPARRRRRIGPLLINQAPPVTNFLVCQNAKDVLKDIFNSPPNSWDAAMVRRLLAESFPLQRSQINAEAESVARMLIREWPFLFHPIGAAVHFTSGANYNPSAALDEFLARNVPHLRYFVVHKVGPEAAKHDLAAQQSRMLMRGGDSRSVTLCSVFILLSLLFKEDISNMFVIVEETTVIPGVGSPAHGAQHIPNTPCLLGKGSSPLTCQEFYVFVDSIRVGGPFSALQGMRVVFSSFFMLNIDYNPKVLKTMQFFERAIMKHRSNDAVHKEVMKALNDFEDFKNKM